MSVKYVLKKLFYGLLVMLSVITLLSSIIFLSPVDPVRLTFGQRADVKTIETKRQQLGLNRSLFFQLTSYLNDISPISIYEKTEQNNANLKKIKIIDFNNKELVLKIPYLRQSYQSGKLVSELISEALPKTFILAFAAILIAIFLGILLGILCALFANTWIDYIGIAFSAIGYSLPTYVAAIFLALFFGFYLSDVTGLNLQGSIFEFDDFGNDVVIWKNLILPAFALGIRPVAIISQLTRSTLIDILAQNYIKTARAKGLKFRIIVFRHALKNALNPLITSVSGWMASLLAGAFFVESVFNFKGLGDLTVTALVHFDLPVVLGAVIFTSLTFVAINILADLLNAYFDPRIKL